MEKPFVVAVDGTAGSGKSSICSSTCEKNSWIYINTGALYRGIGYTAHKLKIDSNDPKQLEEVLDHFNKNYSWDHKTLTLSYQGENISPFLIAEEVGSMASKLASKSIVREKLLPLQRELINSYSGHTVLVDGRDIGTVVCPNAPLKIFMSASIEARATRRVKQLESPQSSRKKP